MAIKSVVFALGGVVRESPLPFLREFEKSHGLPNGLITQVVDKSLTRPDGPQQRLERGEIGLDEFCRVLDQEFAARGLSVSTAEIVMGMSRSMTERPVMVEAIRRIRAHGLKVGALTNGWGTGAEDPAHQERLHGLFDAYLDSSEVGKRKPDPAFYTAICTALGVEPNQVAYVDESGAYLKPAAKLGMTTLKLTDPEQTLRELEALLELDLIDDHDQRPREPGTTGP